MIRQAWLMLPCRFASSSTPTLLRMIVSSLVIVTFPRSVTPISARGDDTPSIPTLAALPILRLPMGPLQPTNGGVGSVDTDSWVWVRAIKDE